MPHGSASTKNVTTGRLRTVLAYLAHPKTVLFLAALFNFGWYFSQSSIVYHFGRNSITFCLACAWYWDWSISNPPSLLLLAAFCMLFGRWKGFLSSFLVSSYVTIEGIIWVSRGSGLFRGIANRFEAISQNDILPFWMAPDWQYLFAAIVSATSLVLLISEIRNTYRLS